MFGAPVDDADHAPNAVRAALMCRTRLEQLNQVEAFQGRELSHRIGLNSGEALAGNIGSRRRFNYTVMSDAVNLASRLEGTAARVPPTGSGWLHEITHNVARSCGTRIVTEQGDQDRGCFRRAQSERTAAKNARSTV